MTNAQADRLMAGDVVIVGGRARTVLSICRGHDYSFSRAGTKVRETRGIVFNSPIRTADDMVDARRCHLPSKA